MFGGKDFKELKGRAVHPAFVIKQNYLNKVYSTNSESSFIRKGRTAVKTATMILITFGIDII